MVWVGRAAFSWLLLLLQSRLVCCCRMACCAMQAMQLLLRLTRAATRFAGQRVVVTSARNVCNLHELSSLRRAMAMPCCGDDKARAPYAKAQTPRFGPVVAKETFEAGESSNAPRMLRSQSELQTECIAAAVDLAQGRAKT